MLIDRPARGARMSAVALILLACLAKAAPASAQCHEQIILPSVSAVQDRFGERIAAGGNTLAVGSSGTTVHVPHDGAVFIFERQAGAWIEAQVLTSGDPLQGQQFGHFLAMDGDTLMVWCARQSSALAPPGGSAVYVFEKIGGGWMQTQRLFDPGHTSAAFVDNFGRYISLDGDRAIFSNSARNVIHVYERTGGIWVETTVITAANLLPFQLAVGISLAGPLALKGDRIISAHFGRAPVHILEHDGVNWGAVAELRGFPQHFERPSLAFDGVRLFVGHEFDASARGSVYAFEESGGSWINTQVLRPNDPAILQRFGNSLALAGSQLAIGAKSDDSILMNAGAAYLFKREGGLWQELLKATSMTPVQSINLGFSVAIAGNTMFASANAGALFQVGGLVSAFVLPSAVGVPYGEVNTNSSGDRARLVASGSPRIDHNCLTFGVTGLPVGQFGYTLMSHTQGYVPLFGGSQGMLHLSLPIVRFSGDVLLSDQSGEVTFSPDLTALPQATVLQPGDTWNFQMWFRDVNPGPTSNTTNGLAVTFATAGNPAVQFPATLLSQVEETVQLSVTVTLSQAASHDVLVPYTTSGTATYNVDWRVEEANPIVIPAGETSYEMTVIVAEDTDQEGDETGVVTLGTPTGGVLGTAPEFTLTIVDDD